MPRGTERKQELADVKEYSFRPGAQEKDHESSRQRSLTQQASDVLGQARLVSLTQ
jgi:hypothetical protein